MRTFSRRAFLAGTIGVLVTFQLNRVISTVPSILIHSPVLPQEGVQGEVQEGVQGEVQEGVQGDTQKVLAPDTAPFSFDWQTELTRREKLKLGVSMREVQGHSVWPPTYAAVERSFSDEMRPHSRFIRYSSPYQVRQRKTVAALLKVVETQQA